MRNVGTLRFIADTTHPGISYIVGFLGRYLQDPCQRHVDALKSTYRYLSSRANDGPTFESKGPLYLVGFTDSDYAGDKDRRRSVSGCIVKANQMLILWISSLQYTVSHSSTESEYISADTSAGTLTWLSSLATELNFQWKKASLRIDNKPSFEYHNGKIIRNSNNDLHLLVENKGEFDIAHSYGPSRHTKHMDVCHHYIQLQINDGVLSMSLDPV